MAEMDQFAVKRSFNGSIKFWSRSVEDRDASAREGHAVHKDEDWITVHSVGGVDTTEYKVRTLAKSRPQLWDIVEEGYGAWKEGRELPLDGTPLVGWSGATRAQVDTLVNYHIKTVENLAQLPDGNLKDLPQGTGHLRSVARDYLSQMQDGGRLAQEMTALRDEKDDLAETVKKMQIQIDSMEATKEPKRGPGRPKKVPE